LKSTPQYVKRQKVKILAAVIGKPTNAITAATLQGKRDWQVVRKG